MEEKNKGLNDASKITQAINWLDKEIKKDEKEIDLHKQKLISQISKINKSKLFEAEKPKKVSFFKKILIIFGYGKKGNILNQLAIISDLIEKISCDVISSNLVLTITEDNFNEIFKQIEKKYEKKVEVPDKSFVLKIGLVDIIFNKNNV